MNLTDYLAIYASVLSTYTVAWNVAQTRTDLRIDVLPAIERVNHEPQSGVCIFIRNVSKVDIHLADVSILFRDRIPTIREWMSHLWRLKRIPRRLGWVHTNLGFYFVDTRCPVRLEPRQSHKVFVANYNLNKVFEEAIDRSIIALVQDQLGKNTYSKVFDDRAT